MISAESFVTQAREQGFDFWSGVPCSYLQPFINYVIASEQLTYVPACNEGEAVAVASGAAVAGSRSVVMLQNSGLGNTVNPLTSLNHVHCIPLLLIITLRGEPGGPHDEPQHALMGAITTSLLELMAIPWEYFPESAAEIAAVLARATRHMDDTQRPFALVMRKGAVAPYPAPPAFTNKPHATGVPLSAMPPARHTRREMLNALLAGSRPQDLIVATTGYTGRELYAIADRANQIYMVGAMGCASSFALGLALKCPQRRVLILDGDGAVLMRLSALAMIGYVRPDNLQHIVFDNGMHESTGGQSTIASSIDFAQIAAASGYAAVCTSNSGEELQQLIAGPLTGSTFIRLLIKPGVSADLPRPSITPAATTERMRRLLAETSL